MSLALWATASRAACPADVCDCLGQAGHFAAVGATVSTKSGKQNYSGSPSLFQSMIDTSVCVTTAKLSGKLGGETEIDEDLLITAASGVGVQFKGSKAYGSSYPGVFVDGDLGTAGSSIKGAEFGVVAGTTDTIGQRVLIPLDATGHSDARKGESRRPRDAVRDHRGTGNERDSPR